MEKPADDPRIWIRKDGVIGIATFSDPGPGQAVNYASLRQAIEAGEDSFILDLTGISYLSSARLGGIVISCKRLLSQGGKMIIVCPERELREVFAVTRLDQVITLCDSMEMAFDWLKR